MFKNLYKILLLNIRKEYKRIFFEFLKNNSLVCGIMFVNYDILERMGMIKKKKVFWRRRYVEFGINFN